MTKYYSYVVNRDYGFAPNPFGGVCTLATCKPDIRKHANNGDWIFGISSKKKGLGNNLIFCMKVTLRLTFNEYWNHPDFQFKKPVMNGSLKQMYGDNIYHKENGIWIQEDSHHSYEEGRVNDVNLRRDTKGENVLISDHFYYFGNNPYLIPQEIKKQLTIGIGEKLIPEVIALQLINLLSDTEEKGYNSDPHLFKKFERFKG
jgi:hypothetical protein